MTDLRGYAEVAHERPAGELLYRFLRGSGLLARLVAADTPSAEEALQNIARFFEIVRAQSALLADDRAIFVAPHLATLIEAGDDPATAELDPDADAVAVLTVHKAKGLEFPVVFLPGMVAGRFPLGGRGETLPLPAGLGRSWPAVAGDVPRRGAASVLRGDDPGARRADPVPCRRLRRRSGASRLAVRARGARPADRGRRARRRRPRRPARPSGWPPSTRWPPRRPRPRVRSASRSRLSFYQIDDYLTCPLKYKYAHVLRVPLAPHHAIIYGAALHKAVQLFHVRHAKGHLMSEAELDEVFESAWSNEGFVSRDHEEARLEAGRAALRRFRAAQLAPDAVIPTYVEREFSFSLGGDRVRGRWDRVDIEPVEGGGESATDARTRLPARRRARTS